MRRLNINLTIEEKQKIQKFLEENQKREVTDEDIQTFADCGCGFDNSLQILPENHPMFGFPANILIDLKNN